LIEKIKNKQKYEHVAEHKLHNILNSIKYQRTLVIPTKYIILIRIVFYSCSSGNLSCQKVWFAAYRIYSNLIETTYVCMSGIDLSW